MKILSVNTGIPKEFTLDGITIQTSMVKTPQKEIHVNILSIEGDIFKNGTAHGTPDAVIYAMSSRRYDFWSQLCGKPLPLGWFGENLSLDHLDETSFYLGDEYQCGGVQLKVTGVRYPCGKLNYVTGHHKMRDEFLNQDWPGIYFQVLAPGTIKPQDDLILKNRVQTKITALDLYQGLRAAENKTISDSQFNDLVQSPYLIPRYKDKLYRQTGKPKTN